MPIKNKSRKMSHKYLALLKKKNASHLPSKTYKKRRTRRQRGGMGWVPPPPHHGWAFNHPHGGVRGQLTMPHTHPSHSIDWNHTPRSFFPQRRYNRGGSCGKTHKKRKHKGGMSWAPPPKHKRIPNSINTWSPNFFPQRTPYRGGSCGKTHKKRKQKGGSAGWNGPAGGAPGFSWWSNPGTWPGVAASMGQSQNGMTQSNHLPLSKYGIPAGVGGEGGPNDPPVSTRNANAGPNNGGTAYQNANNGQPGPPLTNIDIMKQKA